MGRFFVIFEGLEKTVVLKGFTDHGNEFKFLYLLRDPSCLKVAEYFRQAVQKESFRRAKISALHTVMLVIIWLRIYNL